MKLLISENELHLSLVCVCKLYQGLLPSHEQIVHQSDFAYQTRDVS